MKEISDINKKKNKRRSLIFSILLHIIMLLILFLPLLSYPDPPRGPEGILVNLGIPDVGSGSDNAAPSESKPEVVKETKVEEEKKEEVKKPVEPKPQPKPPIKTQSEKIITTETEDPAIAKAKKEEEARKYQEAIDKMEADLEKQRAEEAAKKKAEDEARKKAEYEKAKGKFGGLFGSGEGKGNTGEEGNQGDPKGDPNADALEGLSTGPGKLGGGLWGRGVLASPKIENNTSESGIVVLDVCVDGAGKVISAKYTQRGSSTTDSGLKRLAIDHAYKWKFTQAEIDRQCGTITFDFKFI